jgi:beta-glucosidase
MIEELIHIKKVKTTALSAIVFALFSLLFSGCNTPKSPIYRDPNQSFEKRVSNLLSLITIEEKAGLLAGKDMWHFRGVERLGVPSIQVTDCGHGVTVILDESGSSVGCSSCFPTGVGQAATWSEEVEYEIGKALGYEAKSLGSSILLAPMVNIHRTPLGGRNYETYSEDPHLTGKLASSFIKGVQSEDVGACIKAMAANNQQTNQSNLNVVVSERALHEIYLPCFKIPIMEAEPWAVMTSYNKLNGEYTGEKKWLITDIIKDAWKFNGLVVSDWRGVHSIKSIDAGLDIEMPGPGKLMTQVNVLQAIKDKSLTETELNDRVARILRALIKTKMLDQNYKPSREDRNFDSHKKVALKAAEESLVLLKNDGGLLPLKKPDIQSLAVIGPNAKEARLGGGGSASVTACYSISPLDGLKNYCGDSITINFEEGCQFIGNYPLVSTENLITEQDGKNIPGLKGEYFKGTKLEGNPFCTRVDDKIDFSWGWASPCASVSKNDYSVRWSGKITPPSTGKYKLGLTCTGGGCRLYVDNKLVVDGWSQSPNQNFEDQFTKSGKYAPLILEKNIFYDIKVEFYKKTNINSIRLEWEMPAKENPIDKAVSLARKSNVAVIFAGLSNLFEGGAHDKTDLILPGDQDRLIEAVAKANKNTIVVLINGTPVAMPWINEVRAVIEAYYPGQEGGNAIANVLFGKVNPSGKLPETFPVRLEDNPSYGNFPGMDSIVNYKEGIYVGYRYYDTKKIKPLFAFGHGLSYTQFQYTDLQLEVIQNKLMASCNITNIGKVFGTEVAQLYVNDVESSIDRPEKELKGFKKISLLPGEKKPITFEVNKEDLSFYSEAKKKWIFEPGQFILLVGSSSDDIRLQNVVTIE